MLGFNGISELTGNNFGSEVNAMGIEITDDELLSMDPQLLLQLQKHLRECREKYGGSAKGTEAVSEAEKRQSLTIDDLTVRSKWELNGASFEEVEDASGKYLGTRISQNGVTYIARDWKMTDEVKSILTKSFDLGFDKLWRENHPQRSYYEGGENYLKGCHHIGCSRTHDRKSWLFVLGAESLSTQLGRQKVKEITFNINYEMYVDSALSDDHNPTLPTDSELVPGSFKLQKGTGKNITTHPEDFERIISYVAENTTG